MAKLEIHIEQAMKDLGKKEQEQDRVLKQEREIVRNCSVAIKAIHAGEIEKAEEIITGLDASIKKLDPGDFENIANIAYQEYTEAKILLAILKRKEIPSDEELGIKFETYLLGLLDCIGELRREMLEQLRKKNRQDAEYYFERMQYIYELLLPIRFSNSLLPNFRRKQDVGRSLVENSRSDLLKSL